MTFTEWWKIWSESGHYAERGTRRGQYHMARHYDRGGYTVGNVEIVTVHENCSITRNIVRAARKGRGSMRGSSGRSMSTFKTVQQLIRENG